VPTFWVSLCESSGATVCSVHRGSKETRGQAGRQPAQSLAAVAVGGGDECGLRPRMFTSRATQLQDVLGAKGRLWNRSKLFFAPGKAME